MRGGSATRLVAAFVVAVVVSAAARAEGGVSFAPDYQRDFMGDVMRQYQSHDDARRDYELGRDATEPAAYLKSSRMQCWLHKCWRIEKRAEREREEKRLEEVYKNWIKAGKSDPGPGENASRAQTPSGADGRDGLNK